MIGVVDAPPPGKAPGGCQNGHRGATRKSAIGGGLAADLLLKHREQKDIGHHVPINLFSRSRHHPLDATQIKPAVIGKMILKINHQIFIQCAFHA